MGLLIVPKHPGGFPTDESMIAGEGRKRNLVARRWIDNYRV